MINPSNSADKLQTGCAGGALPIARRIVFCIQVGDKVIAGKTILARKKV